MTYDERQQHRADRRKYMAWLASMNYDPLEGTKKDRSCRFMKTKAPNKSAREFTKQKPRGMVSTNAYTPSHEG